MHDLTHSICQKLIEQTKDQQSVLIFAADTKHALQIQQAINELGYECEIIRSDKLLQLRAETLADFKGGKLKYLIGVSALATDFVESGIDCIALLSPSEPARLYYQADSTNEYAEATKRILDSKHGLDAHYAACSDCSQKFDEPPRQNDGNLPNQFIDTEYDVHEIEYFVHSKKDAPTNAPKTMRVQYRVNGNRRFNEFICFEHTGFPRRRAREWWRLRSAEPIPDTTERAVELAKNGKVAAAKKITVRSKLGEKYDRIIDYQLLPIPDSPIPDWLLSFHNLMEGRQ